MECRGATIVGMVCRTEPKMRKTGNTFAGNCFKISHVNGMLNFNYDGNVLARLAKEGKSPEDFSKGESWHEPVKRNDGTLTPLCRHKRNNKFYLRFRLLNVSETKYEQSDGTPIDKSQIDPFLPDRSNAYANQGVDAGEEIKFVVYGLETIQQITIDKVTYSVI